MVDNSDQLSEIRPGLRDALSAGENVCVTFEVDGMEDKWVQFVGRTVNSAYCKAEAPDLTRISPAYLDNLSKEGSAIGLGAFRVHHS